MLPRTPPTSHELSAGVRESTGGDPRRSDLSPIEPLFRAHFDAIYRYAACRVGRDTAVDVAAETFAQALRSVARFDPDRDPRAWLFGVASNVLRHHRRAERRRLRAYSRAAEIDTRVEDGDSVGDGDRLIGGLARLEPRDRETILLFAWAELSYEEIAKALDIPVGTVRSRIHRARHALRLALTEPTTETDVDANADADPDAVLVKEG